MIAIQQQGLTADMVDAVLGGSGSSSKSVTIRLNPAICQSCKQSLQQYHFWKQIWQYLGSLLGVLLFVICITQNLLYLGLGVLMMGIVLPVIYELNFPAAISATGSGRKVIYEFRSQLCAQEFTQLNHSSDPP